MQGHDSVADDIIGRVEWEGSSVITRAYLAAVDMAPRDWSCPVRKSFRRKLIAVGLLASKPLLSSGAGWTDPFLSPTRPEIAWNK